MTSLGEGLPAAIAKVSEWIGQQEAQAKEMDAISPGLGRGIMLAANVARAKRDLAVSAQQSGDLIAMISAYQQLKPALDLATSE